MTPDESEITNTYIVQPPQTNVHGTVFGGQVMAWMDETAAIVALRFCKIPCVTVSVDRVQFTKPIKMGHILIMKSRVNYTGRTSMEIGIRVCGEDPMTGVREHALSGYLTFVAVSCNGIPMPVPQLERVNEADTRRWLHAEERKKIRLAKNTA